MQGQNRVVHEASLLEHAFERSVPENVRLLHVVVANQSSEIEGEESQAKSKFQNSIACR